MAWGFLLIRYTKLLLFEDRKIAIETSVIDEYEEKNLLEQIISSDHFPSLQVAEVIPFETVPSIQPAKKIVEPCL